jgi:hypothetical protein
MQSHSKGAARRIARERPRRSGSAGTQKAGQGSVCGLYIGGRTKARSCVIFVVPATCQRPLLLPEPCAIRFKACWRQAPGMFLAPVFNSRWALTLRSTGAPTAGHQARAGGTRYIFAGPGLASCRCRPVNSTLGSTQATPRQGQRSQHPIYSLRKPRQSVRMLSPTNNATLRVFSFSAALRGTLQLMIFP